MKTPRTPEEYDELANYQERVRVDAAMAHPGDLVFRTERGNLVVMLSPEEAARRARVRQAIPDPDATRDDGGE